MSSPRNNTTPVSGVRPASWFTTLLCVRVWVLLLYRARASGRGLRTPGGSSGREEAKHPPLVRQSDLPSFVDVVAQEADTPASKIRTPQRTGMYVAHRGPVLVAQFLEPNRRAFVWFSVLRFEHTTAPVANFFVV